MAEDSQTIYQRFLSERTIFLRGLIDPYVSTDIVAQLLYLEKDKPCNEIKLYINSRGGTVQDGLAIYDTINSIKSPVLTICLGNACSMAAIILLGGTKGHRCSLPNSQIMIHQPNQMIAGKETDIANYAGQLKEDRNRLEQIISLHTGKPITKVHADCEKDRYMTAQEAKDYGIIDHIITNIQ